MSAEASTELLLRNIEPQVTTLLTANNQSPRVLGLHAQSKMPIEKGNRCKVDYATLAKYNIKQKQDTASLRKDRRPTEPYCMNPCSRPKS